MENKKVTMSIDETGLNENKREIEIIFINGVRTEIVKGAEVEVDPIVKEVYQECRKNFKEGNTQKKPLVIEG